MLTVIKTAVQLIGNANAWISQLRREKITSSFNKELLNHLVQGKDNFKGAAPFLLGQDFGKKSKDFIDQVKALWSTVFRPDQQPFFRRGSSGMLCSAQIQKRWKPILMGRQQRLYVVCSNFLTKRVKHTLVNSLHAGG